MNAFRRHSAKGWLTAIALGTLVLTGCGQPPADRTAASAGARTASSAATDEAPGDSGSDDGDKATPAATDGKQTDPLARADKTGFRTDTDSDDDANAAANADANAHTDTDTDTDRKSVAPVAPASPADSQGASTAAGTAPFAGSEPFVNISRAWISDGRVHLSVRTAQKKINTRFDTWEIIPGTGAFTTVPMAEDSKVLLAAPVRDEVAGTSRGTLLPYSPTQLVALVNRLDPRFSDGVGYDLVVDDAGRVTALTSLFRP
ncbi:MULTISPECIES: hypothetical protein [unclassified Streptomyces]|uniref:hypothetical protein n=1 Tax=unclassified Streptomyces TaxID=2593676 RepID=UPI0033255F2B